MRTRITLRSLLSILLTGIVLPLWAHGKGPSATSLDAGIILKNGRITRADSLLPVRNSYYKQEELISRFRPEDIAALNEEGSFRNDALLSDLLQTETDYSTTGNSRRALVRLFKILRVKRNRWDARSGARLFNDLANVSVKLKLYSLAMKCYYKATQYTDKGQLPDYWKGQACLLGREESDRAGSDRGKSDTAEPDTEEDNALVDSVSFIKWVSSDPAAGAQAAPAVAIKSEPVKTSGIWESFDDGKTAVSYALILHAKQPVSGKRKSYTHINNVGHLFVTLIKYNDDNSVVSRSFGFYPRKTNIFSATPLHPGSAAVFKDDTQHEWDEIAGKFISERRFQKIIELLQRYDHLTYHLNRNNCTDFGLNVAAIGGISLSQTVGSWPLGRGNNPANAGQSMLEGKVRNTDPDYQGPLFICNNVVVH